MKNLVLVLSLAVAVSSCSKSDENTQTENSIYGTWQLTKSTANNPDGSPNDWGEVENGNIITFNEDFSYESAISPSDCNEISNSVYVLKNEAERNIVEITITCTDPERTFESKHSYTFEDAGHLILTPIEPACNEGCAFLYSKISNE